MTEQSRSDAALVQECQLYCRYLSGGAASGYLSDKYVDCHRQFPIVPDSRSIDTVLHRASQSSVFACRLADCYSAVFLRQSTVRRKLIIVLAILECSKNFGRLDTPTNRPGASAYAKLALVGINYCALVLCAMLLFGPIHLYTLALARARGSM